MEFQSDRERQIYEAGLQHGAASQQRRPTPVYADLIEFHVNPFDIQIEFSWIDGQAYINGGGVATDRLETTMTVNRRPSAFIIMSPVAFKAMLTRGQDLMNNYEQKYGSVYCAAEGAPMMKADAVRYHQAYEYGDIDDVWLKAEWEHWRLAVNLTSPVDSQVLPTVNELIDRIVAMGIEYVPGRDHTSRSPCPSVNRQREFRLVRIQKGLFTGDTNEAELKRLCEDVYRFNPYEGWINTLADRRFVFREEDPHYIAVVPPEERTK